MPDIYFTLHAVDRFLERHAPLDMTREGATNHLRVASQTAVRLREKTINGQEQWEIQNPRCVLVIKHDPPRKGARQLVCVTVLPEPNRCLGPISEEDMEMFQEAARNNSEIQRKTQEFETLQDKSVIEAQAKRRFQLRVSLIEAEERLRRAWQDALQDFLTEKYVPRPAHENVEVARVHAVAALRHTLQYIVYGGGTREDILRLVGRIDSTYLTDSFLNPKLAEQVIQETVQGEE